MSAFFPALDHLPPGLAQRVRAFPVFAGAEDEAVSALLAEAEWFSLPGGAELLREGDNDHAIFLVTAGCLGVMVPGPAPMLIAHVPAGETVGEMSALTGEPHSANLVALRDTELLRISKVPLDRLIAAHPSLALCLMRLVIQRLRRTTRRTLSGRRPKAFALLPLQDNLDIAGIAHALKNAFAEIGLSAISINPTAHGHVSEWFHRVEAAHDYVIYEAAEPNDAWTGLCLRQADRIIFVTAANTAAEIPQFSALRERRFTSGEAELIVLHPAGGLNSVEIKPNEAIGLRHHLRADNSGDIARLARLLAGTAYGLVLAGGGARGFAHIGVVRALREAGMPFDFIGGASMGAIVAAGIALEWTDEEMRTRMKSAFVDKDPLNDFTLPLFSLVRGRKVADLLRKHFGEGHIEDMPINYFCVTSNLTSGAAEAHRHGPLWRALKASVAIPGLLPPVIFDGAMHVDGGIMNNLPIDIMASFARGPVIGVDVAGDAGLRVTERDYGETPLLESLTRLRRGIPGIVHILLRTGTVGNEFHRRAARAQADLVIEPDLDDIGITDWKSFSRAIDMGYAHTARILEKVGLPSARLTSAA